MDTFGPFALSRSVARSRKAGFSLVEVTIAIGIVAFALVGVFGMLLTGWNTFRQAVDISMSGQLTDRVMNQAEQTDFNQLTNPANLTTPPPSVSTVYYFDDQGNQLSSAVGAVYQVNEVVYPSTSMPSSSTSTANPNLATVVIQIAHNPANLTPQLDSVNPKLWNDPRLSITTYSGLVARNPQE